MRQLIALITISVLLISCGTLQKLSKSTDKESRDSLYAVNTDSMSVSKLNTSKDSTGTSSWQKETTIEYYQDWTGSNDSLGTIVVGKQEVSIPNTKMLKRITIKERSSDLSRLIVGSQNQDSTKLIKKENGQVKSAKDTSDIEKVVSHKPKWPYILIAVVLFALFVYLYYNKIPFI